MAQNLAADGRTIVERFKKAQDTIMAKHQGDTEKAEAEIRGLAIYKFGLPLEEFNEMVATSKFWQIAIQKNRHEHMMAQERELNQSVADSYFNKK